MQLEYSWKYTCISTLLDTVYSIHSMHLTALIMPYHISWNGLWILCFCMLPQTHVRWARYDVTMYIACEHAVLSSEGLTALYKGGFAPNIWYSWVHIVRHGQQRAIGRLCNLQRTIKALQNKLHSGKWQHPRSNWQFYVWHAVEEANALIDPVNQVTFVSCHLTLSPFACIFMLRGVGWLGNGMQTWWW